MVISFFLIYCFVWLCWALVAAHGIFGLCCDKRHQVQGVQLSPTLCGPIDCVVHGIFQARILEWVAFPFSSRSSQPRDRTGDTITYFTFKYLVPDVWLAVQAASLLQLGYFSQRPISRRDPH